MTGDPFDDSSERDESEIRRTNAPNSRTDSPAGYDRRLSDDRSKSDGNSRTRGNRTSDRDRDELPNDRGSRHDESTSEQSTSSGGQPRKPTSTNTSIEADTGQQQSSRTNGESTDDNHSSVDSDANADISSNVNSAANAEASTQTYVPKNRRWYRRLTIVCGLVGGFAIAAGLVVTDASDLLFAVAAIGLFGAVLTYFVTPGRFVDDAIGTAVFETSVSNIERIVDVHENDIANVYHPDPDPESAGAELVVTSTTPFEWTDGGVDDSNAISQQSEFSKSNRVDSDIEGEQSWNSNQHVTLDPTGNRLFNQFNDILVDSLEEQPGPLAVQLADGITHGFELARSVDVDVDDHTGTITFSIANAAFGPLDQFDHPIVSFLAVGFAVGLDRPIIVDVESSMDDDQRYWTLSYRTDLVTGEDTRGDLFEIEPE